MEGFDADTGKDSAREIGDWRILTADPWRSCVRGSRAIPLVPSVIVHVKGPALMRHCPGMKAVFCLLTPFCLYASADENADRTAIVNVIAALNEFPQHTDSFTADADGKEIVEQLWKGKRLASPMRSPSDHPTVVISHEPWGEATIDYPGVEIVNPRIESRTIRFITPDVALMDGACAYKDGGGNVQTTPLLFVMKKEGDRWKVASIRLLR